VISFLRFVGILNASIWCGATIFLLIGLPGVFSEEIKHLLKEYVGFPAQALIARYYLLSYCCSAIALAHLTIEWLYLGRAAQRFTLGLLLGLTFLGLAGGLFVQPKLNQLYLTKYWKGKTVEARTHAAKTFKIWHVTSECANLLVAGGLIVYLWKVTRNADNSRFAGLNKMRS
jgi:hypothetical protein